MTKQEALPVRLFLGLLAAVTLATQLVVIPKTAEGYARDYSELAYLEPLYVTALAVALACFEAALLAAWQLLSTAVGDPALTNRSVIWNNSMTFFLCSTAVILAGVCVHASLVAGVGGPAMLFGLLSAAVLVPAAFVLRNWVRSWFAHRVAAA